jgi:hypothetical protein
LVVYRHHFLSVSACRDDVHAHAPDVYGYEQLDDAHHEGELSTARVMTVWPIQMTSGVT